MIIFILSVILVVTIVIICCNKYAKSKETYISTVAPQLVSTNYGIGDTAEEMIRRERIFKIARMSVSYIFLAIFGLFMVFPFYWMILTAVKTEAEISLLKPTFIPHQLALSNFGKAITRLNAWRLLYNTITVGIWSTLGTLITTVLSAFAFTKIKFKGREIIFTIFLATMMIPGEMMVISNYITVAHWNGINRYWSMIVPFMISVYYIYLLRQNFRQVPNELYYAAKVDGTSDMKYLLRVMVPMATPTLITITILKLMGAWNSYAWPMRITTLDSMRLITTGLRSSFSDSEGRTAQGLQMAASFVVTAPLLFVFIFLRKYIMRGVSRSGIKG